MHPLYTKNRTIGLLGGSFNPAHEGHLHITLHALNTLGLDGVWWLVSPQNPLKSPKDLAAYTQRFDSAKRVASDRRIFVSDMERKIGARYSWQTIAWLKRHHPGTNFVWLMGADNLAQFHRWRRWSWILKNLPIIVFDRAPYSHTALRSKTYLAAPKLLWKNTDIRARKRPVGLYFVHLRREPSSSTALRKKLGKRAFLGHNETTGRD